MLINSFDGQGVILDNSSDTSNTKSNLSTSIYINYILLYEYSGEVKKNQKVQVPRGTTDLRRCLAMVRLSTMFPEVGSRTGSSIRVFIIGSRNSSGG